MIRNEFDITDAEFNKIVKPFDDLIYDYIYNNILYDFVAFYIARGYQMDAIWECNLSAQVSSAIETLCNINVEKNLKPRHNIAKYLLLFYNNIGGVKW